MFLCALLGSLSCAWQAKMFYENAFQTGTVLGRGENEIGVHVPFNITYAAGFSNTGIEVRGLIGWSGLNTAGFCGAVGKSLLRSEHLYSSLSIDGEYFFNSEHDFAGVRGTGTVALGYYPAEWFNIYVPVKAGYIYADYAGEKHGSYCFVPGIGIGFEIDRHLILRGAVNVPIPENIGGDILQFPYIGSQLLYRW
jgi:hypothetical protein